MFNRRIFILLALISALFPVVAYSTTNTPTPPVPTAKPFTVVIDPGHGGQDYGAWDGLKEKDAVLAIGLQVAKILEAHGVKVILTRNSDSFIQLNDRVNIATAAKADLFVSIHANYYDRPGAAGVETYHYGLGENLAHSIQTAIVNQLKPIDRGVKSARFLVLRKSTIPAVLVETGFISNKIECALLSTPQYRNRMADAIARGILEYLKIDYKLIPAKI